FDAFGPLGKDVSRGIGGLIALLEQNPTFLLILVLKSGQHPAPGQLLARQPELEIAGFEALFDIVHRGPDTAIPDDHRAAAILALGDNTLEIGIFERVILSADGVSLVFGIERGSLGHGPTEQDTIMLQTQII